ncbi:MAG: Ig-like domain-containing protein, partial [bacterium]|nr:Ig-like domain-containing protein [bacterium]
MSGGTAIAGHNGAVALSLANASGIKDASDNSFSGGLPTNAEGFTLDNTGPTVTLVRADGVDTTLAGAFDVTITFTEANGLQTTGAGAFTADDLQVTNGAATLTATSDPLVWTAKVTPDVDFTGDVQVDLPADRVQDAAGNANTAATQLTVTVDTVAPTVTVTGPPSHDGGTAFDVTVEFSEGVTGFADVADLAITNGKLTAGAGSIASAGNDDGTEYTVNVTPTDSADVTVQVVAGAATDGVNVSVVSESLNVPYVDSEEPTISSVVRSTPAAQVTNADTLAWTVTFSEPVTVSGDAFGVSPALTGAAVTATAATTAPDATWTVQASGGTAIAGHNGAVSLSLANASGIKDASDNALYGGLPSNAEGFTLDNTAPTPTLGAPSLHHGVAAFEVKVTFGEAVNDFAVTDLGVGGGTRGNLTGSDRDSAYTVTVTPGGAANVTLSVAAGVATDAAGNDSVAAQSLVVPYGAPPSLTVEDAEALEGEAVAFTVTLDHAAANGFEVTVTLSDGTARAPADYDATSHTLTFAGTANESHTFTVPTTEDRRAERTKTFDVSLSTDDGSVDASDTAVGRIKDDDHQELVIEDVTAEEGEDLSFTVTLINGSVPAAFTVTIGYQDVTATGGSDYTATAHVLNFAGNDDESHDFTVATADDDVAEGEETFTVTLTSSDTFLDDADTAIATLTDNDDAGVTVSKETVSMAEGGSDTYTLVLTSQPTEEVTITVGRAQDGDADLTASPTSLNFTSTTWSTAQTVTITAAEDDDDFADDQATFTHAASSTDGNYGSSLSIASVAATATDNDEPDTTAPTVSSVVRSTPAAQVTNADTLSWTVTFSEPVNVAAGAFGVSPALTGISVAATAATAAPGATWTVQASGGTAIAGHDGVVALSLANGTLIKDIADNALAGGLPTNAEGFTLDNTAPAVTLARADGLATTLPGAFDVTVTFTEANGLQTTGAGAFTADDLQVTNGSATLTATADPLVWTAKVTPSEDFTGDVQVA